MNGKWTLCLIALLLSVASLVASTFLLKNSVSGPFFIESNKVLEFDNEMLLINQKTALQDEFLRKKEQVFNDSIAKMLDSLAVRRGDEEKLIDLMNLESNVFRHKMIDSIKTTTNIEVQKALESFNKKVKTFCEKNEIIVLFGSGNNSIVYGSGTKADMTDKIIKFLKDENE